MKKIYFLCFVIFGSLNLLSQELNFDDLIYIQSNRENTAKNNNYLSKRNFYYDSSYGDMHVYTLNGIPYLRSQTYVFTMDVLVSLVSRKESTFNYYENIASSLELKLTNNTDRSMGGIELSYSNIKYSLTLIKDCIKVTRGTCEYNYQILLIVR